MTTQIKTVAQYRENPTVDPGDDIRIIDTRASITSLTVEEIASLETNHVIGVTLADSSAVLNLLTPTEIAALGTAHVDRVDATDNVFTVDLEQLQAYGVNGVAIEATDTVTLAEFGAVLSFGDPEIIATLDDSGIDIIDAREPDALTYTIAAVQALGNVQLTAADVVTVQDTADNFAALTAIRIADLAAKNVDVLDITDAPITLSVSKLAALDGMTFVADADVTLKDTGANIATLSATQLGALSAQGIDVVDASDNILSLSVNQYRAVSTLIDASDSVSLYGSVVEINSLTDPEIAAFVTAAISFPDLRDSGAILTNLTASDFTALAVKGVTSIDATDNAFSLTVAEFRALESVQLTQADIITLSDTVAALETLSTGELAALAGRGIDVIDATDGDFPPAPVTPSISISDVAIGEGGVATFTITLSEATTGPVSVAYGTTPNTASVADFTAANGTLNFAAGELSKTITVTTTQDGDIEPDETFNVVLSAPTGATLAKATGVGTISNDDVAPPPPVAPSISISDGSATEGGVVTFTVTLSEATTGPVSVSFGTSPGSASVADFITLNDTLTFAAGETSKTISISTTEDTLFEGDETFNLLLSGPSGGTLADASATGVILNDDLDGPGSITGRSTNKSDIIQGSFTDDRINSGNGNDTVFGNGGNDRLNGGNGNDRLFGGNGDDRLNGENGNDRINGDDGNDRIAGGNGNDQLFGGNGNDRINGDNGNDRLFGGDGNDYLSGGAGRDVFVFDTAPNRTTNRDKIADFNVNNDSVYLDNAVFSALGSKGSLGSPAKLQSKYFTIGSQAKDSNDHVIYDNKKGVLLYDADGKGGEAAVEFATVSKNLKMTAGDFFVI